MLVEHGVQGNPDKTVTEKVVYTADKTWEEIAKEKDEEAERPGAIKLYLAGPLFTSAERAWNLLVADVLQEDYGYATFLPQRDTPKILEQQTGDLIDRPLAQRIYDIDRDEISKCDVLVACYDGADPDSGASWEAGYAERGQIPVVWYRTDMRSIRELPGSKTNVMLTQSGIEAVLEYGYESDEFDVAEAVHRTIKGLSIAD